MPVHVVARATLVEMHHREQSNLTATGADIVMHECPTQIYSSMRSSYGFGKLRMHKYVSKVHWQTTLTRLDYQCYVLKTSA